MAVPLTIAPAIIDPVVPFCTDLPNGAHHGLLIVISGYLPSNVCRLSVNLTCGRIEKPQDHHDIAFHFDARFEHKYVARNSRINGEWGKEESKHPNHLPFMAGREFEMMILVEHHQYKVAVDGRHFLCYDHRIPLDRVTALQVARDVELRSVEFLHAVKPGAMLQTFVRSPQTGDPLEVISPKIPFRHPIPGGMDVSRLILITGKVRQYPRRFSINLVNDASENGSSTRRDSTVSNDSTLSVTLSNVHHDIPFHFNPRYMLCDENVVVRNAFSAEKAASGADGWGPEERVIPFFPFSPGLSFDLMILCEERHFLVAVNGHHYIMFRHRMPCTAANKITINGDVDVTLVQFY